MVILIIYLVGVVAMGLHMDTPGNDVEHWEYYDRLFLMLTWPGILVLYSLAVTLVFTVDLFVDVVNYD
jgi:hypothetical protein